MKNGLPLVLGSLVLLGSYVAKRKLLTQWDESDRTGHNNLTHESASGLIALAIPWDLTGGLLVRNRNVLFGDGLSGKRIP